MPKGDFTKTKDSIIPLRGVVRDGKLAALLNHEGAEIGMPVTASSNSLTGGITLSTGRLDDFTRRSGAVAVDWSPDLGTVSKPAGGTASDCSLDASVIYGGKPALKCTFSTTAADTFVARYTPTHPISLKGFRNLAIPVKITASDYVGQIGTAANPFQIWLKMASGKQVRLRLKTDGVPPGGWHIMSFNRGETTTVLSFSGGATWNSLDEEAITEIDLVNIAGTGVESSEYPIWIGPILRDSTAQPIVTLRFDGQFIGQYSNAWPVMSANGIYASLMVQHNYIGTPGRMSAAQIDDMYRAGCEVGLHCYNPKNSQGYANTTDWPTAKAITEDILSGWDAQRAAGWNRGIGTIVEGFTGNYFSGATTLARQRLIKSAFQAAGVDFMGVLDTSYRMKNVIGQKAQRPSIVRSAVTLSATSVVADVIAQIDQVIASGEWLVITAHDFVEDTATPSGNQIKVSDFSQICAAIKSRMDSGHIDCLPFNAAFAKAFF